MPYPLASCGRSSKVRFSTTALPLSIRAITVGDTGTTPSVTLPSYESTDFLLSVFFTTGTVPSAPAGWTKTDLQTLGTAPKLSLYYRVASGAGSTITLASPSNDWGMTVFSIISASGFDGVTPTYQAGISSSIIGPTITPSGTGRILISGYATASSWNITPPGGQTATTQTYQVEYSALKTRCGYETLAGSGATGTRTATAAGMGGNTGSNIIVY